MITSNHLRKINLLTKDQMDKFSQTEQRAMEECPYKGVSGKMWQEGFVEGANYVYDAFITIARLTLIKHENEKDALKDLLDRLTEMKAGRPQKESF